ncbi:hypothetical protein OA955_00165 [Candidatus Marinimicrobia bacterium]|nr:hypothetical protein [Candidatus Neomarinimicrobiota bacterium]
MDLNSQIELEIYFADHFDTILFPVLADLYLKNNELNRARKVCEIGLKHHKNDPAGLFVLANIEKIEGNLKEAEKILEHILLYVSDHLSAAIQLCEIQTVLGRAKSRLLKSWKHVLLLDSSHQTAKEFVEKIEGVKSKNTNAKKPILKSKRIKIQPAEKKKPAIQKVVPPAVTIDEYADPLKVSPRLATFTLVSVLKNQGLFSQALDVLDALEKKGESPNDIALERETIEELVQKLNKE